MDRFKKEIAVGENTMLFEFTHMSNVNGEKFFITGKDSADKPFSFSLRQKDHNQWKLQPGASRWLYEIETDLSDAIVNSRLK